MARSKPGPSVSPECTGTAVALPSGCLRKTWLPRVRPQSRVFRGRELSLFPWRGEDASYVDLLNPDEFKRTDVIVSVFQAKCNNLTHTFHKGVEALGLGVTTAKGGNSGDEIAFFVLLDQYSEFSSGLHASTLLYEILT